ncbi:hypothetical protein [Legionella nagasakiensis]|nr:hypothetical protein [Legionella nagasakiensis]
MKSHGEYWPFTYWGELYDGGISVHRGSDYEKTILLKKMIEYDHALIECV